MKKQLEEEFKEKTMVKNEADLLHKDSASLHNMIAELQEQLNKERLVNSKKS